MTGCFGASNRNLSAAIGTVDTMIGVELGGRQLADTEEYGQPSGTGMCLYIIETRKFGYRTSVLLVREKVLFGTPPDNDRRLV